MASLENPDPKLKNRAEQIKKAMEQATQNILARFDEHMRTYQISFDIGDVNKILSEYDESGSGLPSVHVIRRDFYALRISSIEKDGVLVAYQMCVGIKDPVTGHYPEESLLRGKVNLVLEGSEGLEGVVTVVCPINRPMNSTIVEVEELPLGIYVARLEKSVEN
ncbi:MAG: hypothetical protein AABX59_03450 [Nanoarchaeota archaeon]